jgi:2-polyprenyl-6-methoxyphenol hydroxylase-like FAD-dependent oxidoreductase
VTTDAVEVLIVGAGPTGLTLACELAARGVRFRLVDKAPQRSDKSRALVVHARTLEIFQRMGFADALVARGRTSVGVLDDTPYPFLLFVSQAETEAALEQHLSALGGVVERGVEVTAIDEDCARFSDGTRVRAGYIVGCDGAHSVVRHAAGLDFAGAAYDQDFVLGDVRLDWDGATDRLSLFLGRDGFLGIFPMAGERRVRLIVARSDVDAGAGDPSLAELEALFRARTNRAATLTDPVWLARFRLHHRGVHRYRAGRLFVAGDAAHIHSPAGGQGMNTGIQDAWNLGWKLALAVQRRADDALLDSYGEERQPVGERLLRFTDRLFSVGTSTNPLVTAARDFLIPRVLPRLMATAGRRALLFRQLSELAIHYRSSPIVEDHRVGFHGGPRAGDRAPDGAFGGSTLFSALRGPRFDLLAFGGAAPTLAARHRLLVDVHDFPAPSPLAQRYGLRGPGVYLLRPDGYVSFRRAGASGEGLNEHLDLLLNKA